MAAIESVRAGAWRNEPSRSRWCAFVAARFDRTLDAFCTILLPIMGPISRAFNAPPSAVAIVLALTSELVVA